MGLPLARLVALCLALASAGGQELLRGRTRAHGHSVCSTWGDAHYKTFDGDVFRFPGLCDYNFASDCRDAYKEFAVHLRRGPGQGGHTYIESILLTIKDDTVYLTHQLAVVNGALVSTPHYSPGLLIEKNDAYVKVYSRAGLALMWNREDSLMLELDSRFQNHTCGLCGDYNGLQTYSEFLSEGVTFSAVEFGNMQKINRPEATCEDPEELPPTPSSCSEHHAECERLLTAAAFEDCQARVAREPYVQACVQDLCGCTSDPSCACSTLAEFSRQCSHAGGRPGNWRSPSLCPKSCPGGMVYLESGSPCMDTCSHLEVSGLCEEHRMDGCFCPEGTVYDDLAGSGCVPVSQCHCKLHGRLYSPGQHISSDCEQCVCEAGRWSCKELPCPGTCALEGGSHITTFDDKKYTFHGDCYYVLARAEYNDSYALLGELAPCGSTDKQTCLKTVVLLADHRKNVVTFKSDGSVLLNELEVNLPHVTASFSVFQPSSYHLIVNTAFGLRLQLQLVPVMQLFITLDQAAKGRVQGLCGNFNGQAGDDFLTAGGLVEATGAGFANSWKAQASCQDQHDWLDDPCALNIESANYAEHWCSLLKKSETPFGRCHSAVDPAEYYKRCKYDTCNCRNTEDCLCAALSSYARACAARGVMLWGWRERVCNKDVGACPSSQVFLYNLTACQQTCRSLAEPDAHCLRGFAPVDGCGCPENSFLDQKGRCVPLASCSCYHRGLYLEPGEVVLRQEERCVCRNARLQCVQVRLLGQSCRAPKTQVDCTNSSSALALRTPRALSCQTLAAGYYHTECVSGCVCPEGQLDDGRGGCVEEEACPCSHNDDLYSPGDRIQVDCNTCTCQRGRWSCSQNVCHGTCAIYGSGHYVTFDGRFYDFEGHCSYVAVQDYCGHNSSSGGSFSIITENVPCGTTGVTCSKAIKIFLGRTELKLEEKHRVVIQRDQGHHVSYTTREVGLYLVVEASIGVIVIWDKRTTVFIKLAPSYKGSVCGLCGNFDSRSNNDFTTRDHMVVDSELDFGNSWKEAPTCPDVTATPDPCTLNPHRRAWAEKQCSIIKSQVFGACHSKVDAKPFYEACVLDSCSCDSGGDCDCFCSAVAAYAQECTKEGACVFWRTPDLCPVFCDFYNPPHECEWHYEPCGNRSFETCRSLNGLHSNISVSYLEGCYPRCPDNKPVFDEDQKECVKADQCGCYVEDTHYPPGSPVPPEDICQSCVCNNTSKVECEIDEGKILNFTQDGSFCYWEICGPDGSVEKHFNICVSTTMPWTSTPGTPSTKTTATTPSTTTSTVTVSPSTTPKLCCFWSDWINNDHPNSGDDGGDQETFDGVCEAPEDIQCRSASEPNLSLEELGQVVQCNVSSGFICRNVDQFGNGPFELCYDYEIRVYCCLPMDQCPTTMPATPTTASPTTSATSTESPATTPSTTSTESPTTSPSTSFTTSPTTTHTVIPSTTTTESPTTTPATPATTTPTTTPGTTTELLTTTFTTLPTTIESPTPTPTTTPSTTTTPGTTSTESPTTSPTTTSTTSPTTSPTTTPYTPTESPTTTTTTPPTTTPGTTSTESPTTSPTTTSTTSPTTSPTTTPYTPTESPTTTPTTPPTTTPGTTSTESPTTSPTTTSTTSPTTSPTTTPYTPTESPTTTTTTPPTTTPGTTSTESPTTSPTTTSTTSPTTTSTVTPGTISTGSPSTKPTTVLSTTSPTTSPTTSTTVSSPTSPGSTTATSPTPSVCQDDCHWTGWLDSGKPEFTPEGGDFESIQGICQDTLWAANISCRAVMYPDRPLEQLGQKLVCDLSQGLVCKNQDQKPGGPIPMPFCINYEISVQCCGYCSPRHSTSTQTPTTTPTTTPTGTSTQTPTPTVSSYTTTSTESPTPSPSTPETPTPTTFSTTTPPPSSPTEITTPTSTAPPPPSTTTGTFTTPSPPSSTTRTTTPTAPTTTGTTPTHTPTASSASTSTSTGTPTATPTATTGTPTPSPTTTETPATPSTFSTTTPSESPTPSSTTTSTGTPSPTPTTTTGTPTPSSTTSGTPTPSSTTSGTPTPASTTSGTPTPSSTTTGTPTPSSTTSGTPTPSSTTTGTPTPSSTTTGTPTTSTFSTTTPSESPTPSSTTTSTGTPSPTPTTTTGTPTPSSTTTGTPTPSSTTTGTPTPSSTTTGTPTPSSTTTGTPTPSSTTSGTPTPSSTTTGTPTTSTFSTTTPSESPTPSYTTTSIGTPSPTPTTTIGTPTPSSTTTGTPPSSSTTTGTPTTPSTFSTTTPSESSTPSSTTTSTGSPSPTPTSSIGTPTPSSTTSGTPTSSTSELTTLTSSTATLVPTTKTTGPTTHSRISSTMTETSASSARTSGLTTPRTSTIETPTPTTTATVTPTTTPNTATTETSTTAPSTPPTTTPSTTSTESPTTTPTTTSTTSPTMTPTVTPGTTTESTTMTFTTLPTTTESPTTTPGTTSTESPTTSPTTTSTTSPTTSPTTTPYTPTESPTTTTTTPPTTTPGTTSTESPTTSPTTTSTTSPTTTSTVTPGTISTGSPSTKPTTVLSTTSPTTSPTTSTTVSSPTSPGSTTATSPTPSVCQDDCHWTGWLDSGKPEFTPEGGDFESIQGICQDTLWAANISCRAVMYPDRPLEQLGQKLVCDLSQGLVCKNQDQKPGGPIPMPFCINYEISVQCCGYCSPRHSTSTQTPTTTPTTTPTGTSTQTPTPTVSSYTTTSTKSPTPSPSTPETPTPTTFSTTTPPPSSPTEITTPTSTAPPPPSTTTGTFTTPSPPSSTTRTTTPTAPTTTGTTPTHTPTASSASTSTSTGTPTATPTATTGTPTPSPTTTETPATPSTFSTTTPSESPTPSSTTTSTGTPSPTPTTTTGTPTPSSTTSGTPTPSSTITGTPTPTSTTTGTPTPSSTTSGTPTPASTTSGTPTPSSTTTGTPTPSSTTSGTPTPSSTTTGTPTTSTFSTTTPSESPTPSSTTTSTGTPSPTPTTTTGTPTPSSTTTGTPTPSSTTTGTPTPSSTTSGTPTPSSTTSGTPTPSSTTTGTPTTSTFSTTTPSESPTPSSTTTSIGTPSPTPTTTTGTPTPSSTTTGTPTPSSTTSGTPTPSSTTSGTPTPSSTTSGTPTPSSTTSGTPTPSSTTTGTPTTSTFSTTTPSESPTPSSTTTSTGTPSPTPTTTTGTPTPSSTTTGTPTPSSTTSGTPTPSSTTTGTPTPSSTTSGSPTPSSTTTGTPTTSTFSTTTPSESSTPSSTTTSTGTPSPTPTTTSGTPTPSSTTTGTPTLSSTTSGTPTPSSTTTGTPTTSTFSTTTPSESPTPSSTTTSTGTPSPTPTTTTGTPPPSSTTTGTPTPSSTTTGTPTTPSTFSTTTPSESSTPPSTTISTGTPSPTPTTTIRTPTPSSTTTGTPTPSSTTTGTPTPSSTTSGTPTPSSTTSGTPTPSSTTTGTPTTSTFSTTTPSESPTPSSTTTSTGTPSPTPTTTTGTPTPSSTTSGTPTPSSTTTGTPTPSSTTTGTPTPSSTTSGTPTPSSTTTGTPTTSTFSTTTPSESPTPSSTTTSTGTPSPTPTTTTGTPTPSSTTTGTPTPSSTTTGTPTPSSTTTGTPTPSSTTSGTPTPSSTTTGTPTTSTFSTTTPFESPTPSSTTTSTGTPSPTPTSTTGTPIAISTTSSGTPPPSTISTTVSTETPSPSPTTTSIGTTIPSSSSSGTPTPSIPGTPASTPSTPGTTSPIVTTSSVVTPTLPIGEPTSSKTPQPSPPTAPSPSPTSTKSSTPSPTPATVQTSSAAVPTPTTLRSSSTPPGSPTSTHTPSETTPTRPPVTESTTTRPGTLPSPTPLSTPSITTSTGPTVSTENMVTCCLVNESYFIPGDVVYNGTHGDTCYYVNCSLDCTLQYFNWSCPSTPAPPTTSPTASTPSPTLTSPTTVPTPTPTPAKGCPDFDPPRQENETWWLCNCTQAICKHDNTVELVEVPCEPPPMPTCSNGLSPVRVTDPDGCCWHWECDCYCTGWGDPHYITFDGLYYSYQGNCTYVLVEEVNPTVDNFGVYIDNYHCDPRDQVSCPRTIIVRHETQEVLITTVQMAPMRVQVQVNRQAVALPYRKYGLQVYESGISYVVDIPELGVLVSYDGLSFSIRLPHRLFGNNTKGQCGVCNNNTADDCVLPGGEAVTDCEAAADQWVVNDPSKPHCPQGSYTTRRPTVTRPDANGTPGQHCGSELCELIKDPLFAQCHTLVPPQHYYDACVFDSCFVPNGGMECASLQAYAALCAQEGVCVDWRNHTHGACSVTCPTHREYRACGPAEEPTCKSSSPQNSTRLVEGCFCPEGTMSYAEGYDVCVDACGCVGPDNVPREFGEHFELDCQDCVCLEGGSGIVCQPHQCRQDSDPQCSEEGTFPSTQLDPKDPCCNVTTCKCDVSLCKEPAECPLGFEAKREVQPGRCCPIYSCEPKGVCVVNNAEYQPGSPVYSSKCQECHCTAEKNSSSQLNVVACVHVPCPNSCSLGFELVPAPGECCQKCEQTSCVITRPSGQHLVLKPGDMQSDPSNNCTFFSCVKVHNQLISSVSNISCPEFNPDDCIPGSITFMPNGCCRTCIPRNETRIPCSTIPVTKELTQAGCSRTVTMNQCMGSCGTFARYSAEAQALDHRCSCCKEERTSQRTVELHCPTGGTLSHTYTHIESCLCQDSACTPARARRSSPRDPRAPRAGRQ